MNYLLLESLTGGSAVHETLLSLGLIVIIGIFTGKLFERIKIPKITGFLVAGIIIGPSVIGIVPSHHVDALTVITDIALGFIAFGIGMEILIPKLKKTGKQVVIITLAQSVFAAVFVITALYIFKAPLWLSLIVGAIATATAPAPILMLTKQYKSKGPVTDTLLPLVGIDDAIGIIIFGILLTISVSIHNGTAANFSELILPSFMEIGLSILVGAFVGVLMTVAVHYEKSESRDYTLNIALVGIILSVSLAEIGLFGHHLSLILTPMITGIVYGNLIEKEKMHRTVQVVDSFNPFFIVAFFTIAGTKLDFRVFTSSEEGGLVLLFGIVYIFARVIGKIFGSWFGAIICKADPNIKKWLGIALIPQGGVEIGLANAANSALGGTNGTAILTIVLLATFIFGLVGPSGVKMALVKSGETTNHEIVEPTN